MRNLFWILLVSLLLFSCQEQPIRHCAIVSLESLDDSLLIDSDDSTRQELALLRDKLWFRDTVNVGFIDGDRDIQVKTLKAAKLWEKYCRIVFRESTVDKADIRVTFTTGGSWSFIGTDCKFVKYPKPTLQLGWLIRYRNNQTEINRTVIHEFGHALGAVHEHQNPNAVIHYDTAKVVAYYAAQGWNRRMVDINVFGKYGLAQVTASEYDPKSIMMYAIPASLLKDPSQAVGWNNSISDIDARHIGTIYPKLIDSVTVDSCIVKKVVIEKDTIIREQVITYKDVKTKIKRDSTYCKDTTIIRPK